jgi:excisionase family DNA binding protein
VWFHLVQQHGLEDTTMGLHPGATGKKSGDPGVFVHRGLPPQDCAALSVNDSADYLGISRSQIYNLLRAGLIKSAHIGSRNVILRTSLDEYLKSLMT